MTIKISNQIVSNVNKFTNDANKRAKFEVNKCLQVFSIHVPQDLHSYDPKSLVLSCFSETDLWPSFEKDLSKQNITSKETYQILVKWLNYRPCEKLSLMRTLLLVSKKMNRCIKPLMDQEKERVSEDTIQEKLKLIVKDYIKQLVIALVQALDVQDYSTIEMVFNNLNQEDGLKVLMAFPNDRKLELLSEQLSKIQPKIQSLARLYKIRFKGMTKEEAQAEEKLTLFLAQLFRSYNSKELQIPEIGGFINTPIKDIVVFLDHLLNYIQKLESNKKETYKVLIEIGLNAFEFCQLIQETIESDMDEAVQLVLDRLRSNENFTFLPGGTKDHCFLFAIIKFSDGKAQLIVIDSMFAFKKNNQNSHLIFNVNSIDLINENFLRNIFNDDNWNSMESLLKPLNAALGNDIFFDKRIYNNPEQFGFCGWQCLEYGFRVLIDTLYEYQDKGLMLCLKLHIALHAKNIFLKETINDPHLRIYFKAFMATLAPKIDKEIERRTKLFTEWEQKERLLKDA